jgi:hypothetical protein
MFRSLKSRMAISDIKDTCHRKFLSNIYKTRNDRSFADVLIRVGEKEFFCHAVHLAAQSDYFTAALGRVWINKREDGFAELELSQFEKETVEAVLEFIYSGKIEFKGDGDISKIAEAADYLLMPDLFELCVGSISKFSSEVIPMYAMLIKLRKTRLAVECLSIFSPDFLSKPKAHDWTYSDRHNMQEIIPRLFLGILDLFFLIPKAHIPRLVFFNRF